MKPSKKSDSTIAGYDSLPLMINDVISDGGSWYPVSTQASNSTITPHLTVGGRSNFFLLNGTMEMSTQLPASLFNAAFNLNLTWNWSGCVMPGCEQSIITSNVLDSDSLNERKNNTVSFCPSMFQNFTYATEIPGILPSSWPYTLSFGFQSPSSRNGSHCFVNVGDFNLTISRSAAARSTSSISRGPMLIGTTGGILSLVAMLILFFPFRRYLRTKKERRIREAWLSHWQVRKKAIATSGMKEDGHVAGEANGIGVDSGNHEGVNSNADSSLIAGAGLIVRVNAEQRMLRKGTTRRPVDQLTEGSLSIRSYEESISPLSTHDSYDLPSSPQSSQSPRYPPPLHIRQTSTSKIQQPRRGEYIRDSTSPQPESPTVGSPTPTPSGNTLPAYATDPSDVGHGVESSSTRISQASSSPPLYRSNPISPEPYSGRVASPENEHLHRIQDSIPSSVYGRSSCISTEGSVVSNPFL